MRTCLKFFMLMLAGWSVTAQAEAVKTSSARPTVVLLHGAFAESSSWNGVIDHLLKDGYRVLAVANPLRSVQGDAAYLSSVLSSLSGEVVLVGHSYAGIVMSESAAGAANVRSLVFVAGYAPEPGESAAAIAQLFPEGTLGQSLAGPVPAPGGGKDLYIDPAKFRAQFAADVPAAEAARMAATQRPVLEAALAEPVRAAAWKSKPSWFIYGELDRNIPRSAQAFMAERARARESIEVPGASHVVMVSHPDKVAALIKRAAGDR